MIKQNDARCIPPMQAIGCFVRSCGLVAEYKTGKALSAEQINALWTKSKEHSYIDINDNVKQSAPIINMALAMLGDSGRFIEIGTFKDGITYFYPSIPTAQWKIDALIQKIKQGGKSITHFRLVDKAGNLIEDPHEPPIRPISIYYSILYHYTAG